MGVNGGGLQVIDIEVLILLYSTYSPVVVALMMFAIHTSYLTYMTACVRDRKGISYGT